MSDRLAPRESVPEETPSVDDTVAPGQLPPANQSRKRLTFASFWQYCLHIGFIVGLTSSLINVSNCRVARSERQKQQLIEQSKFRVLVPLQASSKEYLDFMQMEPGAIYDRDGKDEFTSKVSQNIRDSVKAAIETWFALPNRHMNKEKIDFYFFPEGFDDRSYQRAFERALVEAHLSNYKVIALLGNASSSATQKYGTLCGKQYIELSAESRKLLTERHKELIEVSEETRTLLAESGKPDLPVLEAKIPMLLPLATATSLTHSLKVDGVPAALRLPPANDRQAMFIADVLLKAIKPAAIRTIVVKDLSNKVYSEDLLEGFREHYVQRPLAKYEKNKTEHPDQTFQDTFGRILSVMSIGGEPGELSTPFMYPMLTELTPDALVIFGMTNTSLETLAQAKASNLHFKYIILTDGAVDEYLGSRIASLVDLAQLKDIYLTFPLPCAMPTDLDTILAKRLGNGTKRDFELTHALYVADSTFVILSLVDRLAEKRWSEPAKKFIEDEINEWRNSAKGNTSKAIIAQFPYSKRDYMINYFGNTTNLDYHLYRVEVPKDFNIENPGKSTIGWKHALEICPLEMHKRPKSDQMLPCMDDQATVPAAPESD